MATITLTCPAPGATLGTRFLVKGTFDTTTTEKKPSPPVRAAAVAGWNIQCVLSTPGVADIVLDPADFIAGSNFWAVFQGPTAPGAEKYTLLVRLIQTSDGTVKDEDVADNLTLDAGKNITILYPTAGAKQTFPAVGSYASTVAGVITMQLSVYNNALDTKLVDGAPTLTAPWWLAPTTVLAAVAGSNLLAVLLEDGTAVAAHLTSGGDLTDA